ncbi:unnamed protein product [Orchesella dallaii]|uniref:Integrase catalytic domain-containing protein n=1 Tax=Orchesella dallaii TaxID=48710 RepID=A0ABP1RHL0_9HEXA
MVETRSMAAARRAQELAGVIQEGQENEVQSMNSSATTVVPAAESPLSEASIASHQMAHAEGVGSTMNSRVEQSQVRELRSSVCSSSSRKLERARERLKLEEEAIQMRLQLNQNRLHQLTLEEEDDDAVDWDQGTEDFDRASYTTQWLDAQSTVSPPEVSQTIVKQESRRDWENPSMVARQQLPKPPPLRSAPTMIGRSAMQSSRLAQDQSQSVVQHHKWDHYQPPPESALPHARTNAAPAFDERAAQPGGHYQWGHYHPPPEYALPPSQASVAPPTDAISQLAEALKAAVLQPQQHLDKYLARQTLGKDLPIFNGDVEEWQPFISFYRTSTRECAIPPSQNLVRLQKCLKGRAREAVRALLVSDKNVEEVLRVLEKQFGQPTIIIRTLMEKARKFPCLSEGSYDSLVEFGIMVRNLVCTVESLHKQQYLVNPQLLEELADKLPDGLRLQWAAKVVDLRPTEASLKHFSSWLERITDAALVLNRSVSSIWAENIQLSSTQSTRKTTVNQRKTTPVSKGTLLATEEGTIKKTPSCSYCKNEDHGITDCRDFQTLNPETRMEWVTKRRLCFSCLRFGHSVGQCWRKKVCGENGCKQFHHAIIHVGDNPSRPSFPIVDNDDLSGVNDCEPSTSHVTGTTNSGEKRVLLRILPVIVKGPSKQMKIYAMCDEGSTVTLMDSLIAQELGVDGPVSCLNLRWTNETSQQEEDSKRVSVSIRGLNAEKFYTMQNVRTVNNFSLPVHNVCASKMKRYWQHLSDVQFEDIENAKPSLLIGQDNINLIIAREVVEGPKFAPVASNTKLGWVIHGNVNHQKSRVDNGITFCISHDEEDQKLHDLVKRSFEIDAIGISMDSSNLKSKEEKRAESMMEQLTVREGNRFKTGLLWKEDFPSLPNNYSTALKRLQHIEKKMDGNSDFRQQYTEKINSYLEKGYARKLTKKEANEITKKTWYLPHFFAYHPNKPGKPRFVFDAAAKWHGVSLNDNLIVGPDTLKSLPGILLKFREHRVAFTADIREMFHQVTINEEDQHAQRFLWRGSNRDIAPEVYVMQVMTFGAACSPFAAQFVKNKNALEWQSEFPEAVDAILNHHYVDDLAHGAQEEKTASRLISEIIEVHKRGGFQIVKWACSSRAVLETIPEDIRDVGNKDLSLKTQLPVERVLGLKWDPNDDCFQFATSFNRVDKAVINGTRMPTKREVLKTVMSVYDPLGFLSHFVIKAKILYQKIWKVGIDWDDVIPESLQREWKIWIEQLVAVPQLNIPRYYFSDSDEKLSELHIFCDASSEAYAAVAYIRTTGMENVPTIKFAMGKARVAPVKPHSIPRLELQSALMAVRLATFIEEEQSFKISRTVFWTDAKTIILWLRSDVARYKPYVAHRIGEILEKSNVRQWRWISTKLNPADDATRTVPLAILKYECRWFQGPQFLLDDESEWPNEFSSKQVGMEDHNVDMELKKEFCGTTFSVLEQNYLPDCSRFSKFTKLIRSTAWIRNYVMYLKNKIKGLSHTPELTVSDIKWAEIQLWKRAQAESFPEELSDLMAGKSIRRESRLAHLSPFLDEDALIRMKSRIIRSPEIRVKEPVILDSKNPFTRLLIEHYHAAAFHQGQEYVVNELRQIYCILNIRSAVKSVWNSCLVCKHRKAAPRIPEMAPLPAFRVTKPVRPFSHCGLDYFGPLTVTKFRRQEKRWVALFTCMNTRAVHLELVDNLTTDSTIMAIMRMSCTRGWPQKLYSDNGTNLRGANNELKKALRSLDQSRLTAELSLKKVEWHFIPPSSPHFGGAWERMVRSVKTTMKAILKEQSPKEEVLRTVLSQAMDIVNSRPLCYVPNDANDLEVLTPNCFLIGTTSGAPILGEFDDGDFSLRKQWRISQRFADQFWKRWVREYLPTLTRITKWKIPQESIAIGNIVVIADENQPRNQWLKGRVTAIFPGQDGKVRVAEVWTKNGTFRRSVAKLCVLDSGQVDGVRDVTGTPGGGMSTNTPPNQ